MEIRASTDAAIRNQRASIKALEIQIGKMSKVLQEKGSESLPSSTEPNLRDRVKSISTANVADIPSICRIEPSRHVEVLKGRKKLQVNSAESATSLKRLIKKKTRIKEKIKATLNEHYSEFIKYYLPPKEKDPRSFTLPCKINNMCFDKALIDLGAGTSVMPYSTFTHLSLGKLAPTKLIIELVDKTMKRPKGIAENVLVGIDSNSDNSLLLRNNNFLGLARDINFLYLYSADSLMASLMMVSGVFMPNLNSPSIVMIIFDKWKDTSIGARDTGFRRGKQAKEGS
nr:hypothetical protein [Tanacetum cinerariifolium]